MVVFTKPPLVEKCSSLAECVSGTNIIVIPVFSEKDNGAVLDELTVKILDDVGIDRSLVENKEFFSGNKGEIKEIPLEKGKIAVLLGLGEQKNNIAENARRAFGKLAKQLVTRNNATEVLLVLDNLKKDIAGEAVVGFLLGGYRLEAFSSEKKVKVKRVLVSGDVDIHSIVTEVEGVYLARDIANAPPNEVYPEKLASLVRDLFQGFENVTVEVIDYGELVEKGFGGIINVGKGSVHKPVLIIIRYNGGDNKKPVAIVGKTVVFDAGGINLKPSHSLFEMRLDKAGGAAVLGATWIIVKKKLPINTVTLLPAVINVPSGESYLPSSVIRMWDGTLVEVGNTDAEGRLILADAIAYAAKGLEAECIIDLATLTGSIVVGLGPLVAGVFTRSEKLKEAALEASKNTGEKLWPMPMLEEYKMLLSKSAKLGDVSNIGIRWGDDIYAAVFLEKFSHGKEFMHIDIAGPGIGSGAGQIAPEYWPSGLGPGYGARLVSKIIEYLIEK